MYRLRRDEKQKRDDSNFENPGGLSTVFVLDVTGRKNGRGAYLCPSVECLKKAVKGKGLERSFKMAIPREVYDTLEKEMVHLG